VSLHLPIAILAALSLPSGGYTVCEYDGPLMGNSRASSAHSSLNEARIQLDLSEVIGNEPVATLENLNASIAHDLRIVRERVANEDVTIAPNMPKTAFAIGPLNPPDHGPMMLPMSFSARAKLFGLAICAALIALILALFLDIL
jgi:hypothetical protein